MPLLRDCKNMQWRWSVVLIMVLGASAQNNGLLSESEDLATFDFSDLAHGKKAPSMAGSSGCRDFMCIAKSNGFQATEFKASKSTDKKVDWIKQTGCTDKEKVCTDGKLEVKVAGDGEILVAKVKALPSDTDAAWKASRPERKAMMGNTSDTKPFWAASFVGSLQTDTDKKGAAIRLGFVKMSICKMRSSSNGCEDSELEDAAATQEFEKGSRRLLDSQSSGDLTCCTIKKMIHHCTTREKTGAPFKECDVGGKVLAGMMV